MKVISAMENKDKTYVLLDEGIAESFQTQAKKTKEYPLDYGEMCILKKELMNLCGVTELEAHNILCNRNVGDYINKYTGIFEGRRIDIKEYTGEIEVTYRITEDEIEIFYGD